MFPGIQLQWNWDGPSVARTIEERIDVQMHKLGQQVVEIAQRYAPYKSGALRNSIDYDYNEATGTIAWTVGVPYGIFVEYGTRNMMPHPYLRPAINTVGSVYGWNMEMVFAETPHIKAPILASGAGFHLPSTLTSKQVAHVRKHLLPTSKRHFISNVSRARMSIRRRNG